MKNKIWKIISIVNIIIIIFIITNLVIKFYKSNQSDDEDDEIKVINTLINKEINIQAGTYNQLFQLKQMINNFKVDDGYYTKLEIYITNNRNIENYFNMNEYTLVDDNDNTIANCYPNGDIKSSTLITDKMPILTGANMTTNGYLYCDNNYNGIKKLKIKVIDYGIEHNDGSIEYQYINYYIDLV